MDLNKIGRPNWGECLKNGFRGYYGPIWIVAAAIKVNDEILSDARHHLIIQFHSKKSPEKINFSNQGFLTNTGKFVTREKGLEIANSNGQFCGPKHKKQLFSEDLWSL